MKHNRAMNMRPPTTASPAMTPLPKPLLPSVEPFVVELDVPSMTLCLTHSPNEHELSVSPFNPNRLLRTVWPNEHVELPSQVMVRMPSSLLMVAVKFVEGTPPQNVVLVMHVHLRSWHSHVEGLASVIDCTHESAVQKNCSTPS